MNAGIGSLATQGLSRSGEVYCSLMAGLLVVAEVELVQYSFTCILSFLLMGRPLRFMHMSEGALEQLAVQGLQGRG